MATFPDFPTLSASATILYPEDAWSDPDVVSQFEDQQSVEVQSTGSGGYFSKLSVIIEAQETEADSIFTFLKGQRLRGIPFYFTHRKRGRILVRYWPDTNTPTLPYTRVVAGVPDRVRFDLPLREEAIGRSGGGAVFAPGFAMSGPSNYVLQGGNTIVLSNGANHDVGLPAGPGLCTFSVPSISGPVSIDGFAGGSDGQIIRCLFPYAQQFTIVNGGTGSATHNRIDTFLLGNPLATAPGDVQLQGPCLFWVEYSESLQAWMLEGTYDGSLVTGYGHAGVVADSPGLFMQRLDVTQRAMLEIYDADSALKWGFGMLGGGAGFHIFDFASSSDRAVFRTSGQVLFTNVDINASKYACLAYKNGGTIAIPSDTVNWYDIPCDATTRDITAGGVNPMHSNTVNPERLTLPTGSSFVPTGGVMLIAGNAQFASNATGYRALRIVRVSGATTTVVAVEYRNALSGIATTVTVPALPDVGASGDYYKIQAQQNSGGTLNIVGGADASVTGVRAVLFPSWE